MEDIPQAITPKEEKDMKLIEEKEFQLNFNEDIFILKIGENMSKKNIIMKISNTTKLEDIFYEHYFDFDELVKLDKTFRSCDELEEIFSSLIACFNEKKIIIKEVKNDEIILGLKIIMPTGKEKIIDLKLNKKELEKDSIIKELCKKINILEEENKNLKNETKSLKDEIKVIKDELNVIKKWKEDNEKEKENENKWKQEIDSNILTKFEDYQFIEKIYRINDENFINKKLKMKLLYRVSRDGDSSSTFHQKCDNIKDTITLVKTKNDLIFGGYTNETWNGDNIYKKDDKAFCFSLDLKRKYNNKKTDYSIKCYKGYGPCFGCALFWIYDNCLSKGGFMNDGLNQNYDNQMEENEINFGNGKFKVTDVEVYEAKFE